MKTTSLFLALAALAVPASAAENMIGRQSQNEGMLAVPAPGKVAIDGDLKDWDWSGRIWVFADSAVRSRFSVEAAAMWDHDNLYLAAKWKDPTPMYSLINPADNPDEGWKEDAWQMRVLTDHPLWLTTWYYTPKAQPVLHIARWKDPTNERKGQDSSLLAAKPGGTDLGEGAAMAYKKDADGQGFVQEIKLPWKLLYKNPPTAAAGQTLRIGNEFLWSDPTGKAFPSHRYADNMQPGKTSREFYWSAKDAWGDVKLVAKGDVPVRNYVADGARIPGTVPVRVTIPTDAVRFTIVLESLSGQRVRTLAADADPADYLVPKSAKGKTQVVEVKWDGLDDAGKPVALGSYKVRGLTHKGLGAEYEMCFYNPGTPPWATIDGRGAWGSDHKEPTATAAGGGWTFVCWSLAEGGSGIVGIDPSGQKRWSDRRGIDLIAADDQYVYAYVTHWYTKETLCRFGLKDGAVKPFVLDGKERTFDLPLTEVLGNANPGTLTGLAVSGGKLYLATSNGKIAVLDAGSAKVLTQFDAPGIGQIAATKDGKMYGLMGDKAVALDATAGVATVSTPGLAKPVAISTDADGNLVIVDNGPDQQVKAFSPAGKLVYTCGKKAGRPIRGVFDEQAISHPSSVSVDSKGQVWVVESWNFPRRVSVWGRDGKLIRDYVGNTGYAGSGCYLHDQDPTLAYCGPIEFKIDQEKHTWKVSRVLWVPDKSKGESWVISPGSNPMPQRFSRTVNGKKHEYMFVHDPEVQWGTGNVLFMERENGWAPVAALCLAGHISGSMSHGGGIVLEQPSGELAGLNAYDGIIWNDSNADGKVQRAECTIVKTDNPGDEKRGGRPGFPIGNGWGSRVGDDFSIYTDGISRYKPVRINPDGAPVYSMESKVTLGKDNGDLVPVPGEDRLLVMSFKGYPRLTWLSGVNLKTGEAEWTYPNPFPGVHGSHEATMPKPGMLIGPLKTCGVADMGGDIGKVFLMRGNLGQDFLMTTDGVYVGALFQDGRLPGESLPNTEEALRGMPMEGFSEGGEPFNGWFGKQADGKVRLTTGMAREAAMILQIKGLETIQRFDGGKLTVSEAELKQAAADNAARAAGAVQAKTYTINARVAPVLDGLANDWADVPALTIAREGQPQSAKVKLAYDAANLYAFFDVQDSTPWKNGGKDFARLFKSGDAVDIQLSALGAPKHTGPAVGDRRVVIANFNGKPTAVLMAAKDPGAPAELAKAYTSPVGTKKFDRVEIIPAQIIVKTSGNGYQVEAAIPWTALAITPKSGATLRGDVGFIASDNAGLINAFRTYWANQETNLVNDEPLEAWLYPENWGELKLR